MKDFEREELNTAELEQIGEFASFPAEEFKSEELYLNNKEEFKVKEIQPQSFLGLPYLPHRSLESSRAFRKQQKTGCFPASVIPFGSTLDVCIFYAHYAVNKQPPVPTRSWHAL